MPSAGSDLGHGVYCIGLTADFRQHLTQTVRAHVGVLADVLDQYCFDSFLYLSSTRVYLDAAEGSEVATIKAPSNAIDQVYNLSKMVGEGLCLSREDAAFRVARLSNVIGRHDRSENLLSSLIRQARTTGQVTFRTSPQSEKDYVDIRDVCAALASIALSGNQRLYNVASGTQTTNARIAELLRQHFAAECVFQPQAPTVSFPQIAISRLQAEFSFDPTPFSAAFEDFMTAGGETEEGA